MLALLAPEPAPPTRRTREHAQQRGLAGAVVADEQEARTDGEVHVDVVEHRAVAASGAVVKGQVLEEGAGWGAGMGAGRGGGRGARKKGTKRTLISTLMATAGAAGDASGAEEEEEELIGRYSAWKDGGILRWPAGRFVPKDSSFSLGIVNVPPPASPHDRQPTFE